MALADEGRVGDAGQGAELPAGVTDDDGQQRGLVFTCFVASISRQFEAVQVSG